MQVDLLLVLLYRHQSQRDNDEGSKPVASKTGTKKTKKTPPIQYPPRGLPRPEEPPIPEDELWQAEEDAVIAARKMLRQAIEDGDITQAILADRIEVSRSNISQVLERGDGNPTVRTCAKWLRACGYRLVLSYEPLDGK